MFRCRPKPSQSLLITFFYLAASFLFSASYPFKTCSLPVKTYPPPGLAGEKSYWYVVKLGEMTVGYAQEKTKELTTSLGQVFLTQSSLKMVIRRLGVNVELASFSEWEETVEGNLRRVSLSLKLSNQETTTRAEVSPEEITVFSSAGGQEFAQKIPYSGRLLGPEGINRLTNSSLRLPGEKVSFSTFMPEMNAVIHAERQAEAWEEVTLPGSTSSVKALRVKEITLEFSTQRILWFDEKGVLLAYQEASPLGELKVYLSPEKEALAAARGEKVTDLPFQTSLLRANVRLPSARSIERIKLRLRFRQPEPSWPRLPDSYQKIVAEDKDSLILEIQRPPRPFEATSPAHLTASQKEQKLEEYLQANAYINKDDPLILKVVSQATQGADEEWAKALRLRDWVSQNIVFDPGIVFAPSTEVIRQRRGTCVSFAVLLTTLARAAGIPARFVLGYAYVNGVWGGHAWAELYLNGNWLPFDAALPSVDIADACRLAIAVSSLNLGLGEAVAAGQKLFSRVEIEILEYQLNGRTFLAPPRLYEVNEREYKNLGLGMVVRRLASFSFTDLDKTWPDNTLLVLKNEKAEVRLKQQTWRPVKKMEDYLRQLAGPSFSRAKIENFIYQRQKAFRLTVRGQAVAYFFRGTDLWEILVKAADAPALLEKALQAISFLDE